MLRAECSSDGMPRTYGYLPGTSTPLFLRQNDTYYWYRTDRLGIPHTLVESNGTVVWSGTYDAFGNCVVDAASTLVSNLRLPGQYYDAETGLYYNLNRYYDPKTGRYLQPDPAGDGLNPYTYVGANPVNAIDPNGLCAARMATGVAEIGAGFGIFAKSGGFASIAAWMLVVNGADNFQAGWMSLLSGEEWKSPLLEAPIHTLIPNDTIADMVYMSTQLAIGYAGLRAEWALQATRSIQTTQTVTVYRFADRMDPNTLKPPIVTKSNASSLRQWWLRLRTKLSKRFRERFAHAHMRGYPEYYDSPFVSVGGDPLALASSTDPWLRTIATGKPGIPGVMRAPDIGIFRVPLSRLIMPHSTNPLSIQETEMLFYGDDLADYLVKWIKNPL